MSQNNPQRTLSSRLRWIGGIGIGTMLGLFLAFLALVPDSKRCDFSKMLGSQVLCPYPTSTPQKIRTPVPPLPTPSLIPTPALPIYDDFDDGTIYADKWIRSPYGGRTLEYELSQVNGTLRFDLTKATIEGGWDDLIINKTSNIQDIQALITFETEGDYVFGISSRVLSMRYDFMLSPSGDFYFADGKRVLKEGRLNGDCCPITHLIGFRADGIQWSFFVDGILSASIPFEKYPIGNDYGAGFQLNVGGGQIAKVYLSKVWVQFAN